MVKAPWTTKQVESLRDRQKESSLPPYTCGKCGLPLNAVTTGWKCDLMTGCDYEQDWAHSMDVTGEWRKLVSFRKELDAELDKYLGTVG